MGASYAGLRVTYAVEGRGIEVRVDVVGTSDGVRSEEGDDFEGSEPSGILETLENFGHIVLRLRNQAVDSGDGVVGAAGKELQAGCAL